MSEIVRRIVVESTAEEAFEAFVDVSQVLSWFADGAVIGRRLGGNWGLGWYADPDSDAGYQVLGAFEEFDPGIRFVVTNLVFTTPEGEEFGPMRLTVEFSPSDRGVVVSVRQEGLRDEPGWDGYRTGLGPGWERSLHDLKGWLEEGRKLPGR